MDLEDLQEVADSKVKRLRRLEYLLARPKMINAWDSATEKERENLRRAVQDENLDKVELFIYKNYSPDLCICTLKELRGIAGRYGLRGFTRMSKERLISEIDNVRRNPKTA